MLSLISVAVRSKAYVSSIVGFADSNPVEGMDIFLLCFFVCCVGSDLCDKLITRSEEFYRVCVSNCVRSINFKNEAA
jgi:hypothetical protein